ncbi:MAG: hypothetical protein IPO72_02610 [Saprospiraceae bacterium]|nr:hypothetical protein [Candidatus Vicinibacter affinis]
MSSDQELNWVGKNWISYIKETHQSYYKELKKDGTLKQMALKKQTEYEMNIDMYKKMDLPPGGAEELARELLYS